MRDAMLALSIPAARLIVKRTQEHARPSSDRRADAGCGACRAGHVGHAHAPIAGDVPRKVSARSRNRPRPFTAIAERWVLPSDLACGKASSVIHEIMGLVYYTARGWYKLP